VNERPIGVFDSGLGGLTVLQALADLLPHEHLVYLGDTARYPYGPRDADELIAFSRQIVDYFVTQGVKLVVVACNSATAAALDLLRAEYDVPVIGVVEPGVRAAVKATRSGHVGVVGTAMTESSKIYELTAERLRAPLTLAVRACPQWVTLVEEGEVTGPRAEAIVAQGLRALDGEDIDTLILGCTHFPLLSRTISEVVGRGVTLVSSADEIAFEVLSILQRTGWMRQPGQLAANRTFVTTGDPDRFAELGARFLGEPLSDVRAHAWEA
jgi:glutamate racemase